MTAAPTPSAEELDALEKRLRSNWRAWDCPEDRSSCINETGMAMDCKEAADAIKALRHQVLALQQEVTRQTALKNQAMRLNDENPCGG